MGYIVACFVLLCFGQLVQAETTLTYMFGGPPKEAEIQAQLARAFEEANPDIKINLLHATDDYVTKFKTMMVGGTPPDVLNVNSPTLTEFMVNGFAEDITSLMANDANIKLSDFFPSTIQAVQYKDHYYALPLFTSPVAIFINQDHFDQNGIGYNPNWTFNEFGNIARKLTKDLSGDNIPDRWGLSPVTSWLRALKWAWANGGGFWQLDENFNAIPTFTHPGNIAALTFWQDIAFNRPAMGGNWWNGTATLLDDPWSGSLWGMLRAAEESSGLHWSVGNQPTGTAGKASTFVFQLMMIPAGTTKKEAAYRFASWLASREGQRFMQVTLKYGGVPTRRSVITDPGYLAIDPRIKAFVEVATYMRPVPFSLQQGDISSAISARVTPLLKGQLSPTAFVTELQEVVSGIIANARKK